MGTRLCSIVSRWRMVLRIVVEVSWSTVIAASAKGIFACGNVTDGVFFVKAGGSEFLVRLQYAPLLRADHLQYQAEIQPAWWEPMRAEIIPRLSPPSNCSSQ